MTITLPDHKTIIKNRVFAKDEELASEYGTGAVLRHLIIPRKYTQPAKDDVIAYVREQLQEPLHNLILERKTLGALSVDMVDLESMLASTPDAVASYIVKGDEEFSGIVKSHMFTGTDDRAEYLMVDFGLTSTERELTRKEIGPLDEGWYTEEIVANANLDPVLTYGARMWIRLPGGCLPSKDDLRTRLMYDESDPLNLAVDGINYRERGADVIRALCTGLCSREQLEKLHDISDRIFEASVIDALRSINIAAASLGIPLVNQRPSCEYYS